MDGGGDSAQGGSEEGGADEGRDGRGVAGSSEPGGSCHKRRKVMKAGGSGGVQKADVSEHQDQRDGASDKMRVVLEAEAASIDQHMLEGIVGRGCMGYVFSLR